MTTTPPVTTPPAAGVTPPGTSPKLAGKYDAPEQLEQGFRELTKTVLGEEIPAGAKLYGQGGMYADLPALEAAYKGREAFIGRLKSATPAATPATQTKPEGAPGLEIQPAAAPTVKGIAGLMAKAGLTGQEDAIAKQWTDKGELTTEQYAGFEKAGLDREAVDTFMAGQVAIKTTAESRITAAISEAETIAGGKSQLENLRKWAAENMDKDRLAALNDMVKKSPSAYPEMVRSISAAYAAKNGSTDALAGDTAAAAGGAGGGSKPTTLADFRKLNALANSGDKNALKVFDSMSPREIAALMDSPT